MIKLKAPAGATSASYNGEEYQVADGFVDVPDNAADALASHGFSIPTDDDLASESSEDPATMGRRELFAFLKGKGVAAGATVTTEDLRKLAVDASKPADPAKTA